MTKKPGPPKKAVSSRKQTGRPKGKNLRERALGPMADEFGTAVAPVGRMFGKTATLVSEKLFHTLQRRLAPAAEVKGWVTDQVGARLEGTEPEKIVDADPRIAGPAAAALSYTMDDTLISSMFADLIAANMNSDTKSRTHPAFVAMIKEMQPLDAQLLQALRGVPGLKFEMHLVFAHGNKWQDVGHGYCFDTSADDHEVARSLDNLRRLGVVSFGTKWPILDDIDEREKAFKDYFSALYEAAAKGDMDSDGQRPSLRVSKSGIYITDLGEAFATICMKSLPKIG